MAGLLSVDPKVARTTFGFPTATFADLTTPLPRVNVTTSAGNMVTLPR